MTGKIYSILLHLTALLNFVLIYVHIESYFKDTFLEIFPDTKKYGGPWTFITFWNIVLQLVYFCLALLNDVLGTESRNRETCSNLQKSRDFLFATLAFPGGIFIPLAFWIIFGIDQSWVDPESVSIQIFSPIPNHMAHTLPFPLQILELFLVYHIYPRRIIGILINSIFGWIYVSWMLYIAYSGGIWVYPIFEVLDTWLSVVVLMSMLLFSNILYVVGEFCNTWIWEELKSAYVDTASIQNGQPFTNQPTDDKKCKLRKYRKTRTNKRKR